LIVAVLSILFSVPPSILAGYGFYRYARFRLKSALFRFLFLVLAVPPTIVIVPYFLLLSSWGLLDSLVGLAITYVAFLIPIQTILYYSYLFSIPRQIEEAAIIDGASKLEILGTITLPLSLPAVLAISVYAFVLAWNEFAFAVTLLRSPSNWTSVLGLYSFIGEWNLDWNGAMVTALYITIPALIFFFVTQKYYIRGMTAGAVKGG
jgi:ABC-type glycerol-3-phosphate transport system permease component